MAREEETHSNTVDQHDKILYPVQSVPNPLLWPIFALQYLLITIPAILATAVLLAEQLGVGQDGQVRSELFSLGLFTSGLSTVIQILVGCRLPTLEGMNSVYIVSIAAIVRATRFDVAAGPADVDQSEANGTAVEPWKEKMAELQGNLLLASATHFLLGATGIIGFLLRFIGPITLAPTIALVGISIGEQMIPLCEQQWGIAALSIVLVIICSLVLVNVTVPLPVFNNCGKLSIVRYPMFKLNAVVLAVGISWLFTYVLTATDVLPSNSTMYGHMARTDVRHSVLYTTPWFHLPRPFNYGMPTISGSGYVGMVTVNLVTIMELIGGYFAIARVTDATPPPVHAVNRGIAVNGLCCAICSVFGNVCGNVPYLNILGCMGVTKIASRTVFLTAALLMILGGVVAKIGAVFILIPDPVVGGVNLVTFAMVAAVGVSLLQHVDLSSVRNLLIIGLCLLLGLKIPDWTARNLELFKTGSTELDQVMTVLLTTPMFVTGFVGCLLDNITPGTPTERGIIKWRENDVTSDTNYTTGSDVYEFPYLNRLLVKLRCCVFCPISPTFDDDIRCRCSCGSSSSSLSLSTLSSSQLSKGTFHSGATQQSDAKRTTEATQCSESTLQNEAIYNIDIEARTKCRL